MKAKGKATVYGTPGAVGLNTTGTTYPAIAAVVEDHDGEQQVEIEKLKDGSGTLQGFMASPGMDVVNLTLVARGASYAEANAALKYPPALSKIKLSGFPEGAGTELNINGVYIYESGAKRSFSAKAAVLKLTIYRPLHDDGTSWTETEIDGVLTPIT